MPPELIYVLIPAAGSIIGSILGGVINALILRRGPSNPDPNRRNADPPPIPPANSSRVWGLIGKGGLIGLGIGVVIVIALLIVPASPDGLHARVSLIYQARGNEELHPPAMSADGRRVAFGNNAPAVTLIDTRDGSRRSLEGAQIDPYNVSISPDGGYVAYFGGGPGSPTDVGAHGVILYDIQNDNYEPAFCAESLDPAGGFDEPVANGLSVDAGRLLVASDRSNLIPGFTPPPEGEVPIVLIDRTNCSASLAAPIAVTDTDCGCSDTTVVLSGDGQVIGISSDIPLTAGDDNAQMDVFVRNVNSGQIARVSVRSDGSDTASPSSLEDLSADGRYVLFESADSGIVTPDTGAHTDLFMRDTISGTTSRLTAAPDASEANGSVITGKISGDGGTVAFTSDATNIVPGSGSTSIFVWRRSTGQVTAINAHEFEGGVPPRVLALSGDGHTILVDTDSDGDGVAAGLYLVTY